VHQVDRPLDGLRAGAHKLAVPDTTPGRDRIRVEIPRAAACSVISEATPFVE
jgi:hypothetical protein